MEGITKRLPIRRVNMGLDDGRETAVEDPSAVSVKRNDDQRRPR